MGEIGFTSTLAEFEVRHIPDALALWKRSPGVGLSGADEPERLAAYLQRNPGSSFVGLEAGKLVGTMLCGHDGRRGLIHHLVVAETHRRRGLGRRLLRAGLKALRGVGIDKCHILVFKANEPGLAFWRAVGAEERVSIELFSLGTGDVA
jgi:ribosomal protein S18 acetylase RimI-like enzyme